MTVVTGPAAAACLLLVGAGVAKAVRPHDTARALSGARLPANPTIVRAGGLVEAAVGAAALATGHGLPMLAAALSYLGFAVFVGVALGRGLPLSTCGCFGEPDTPPSLFHVVIVIASAAVCGAAFTAGAPPIATVVAVAPAAGVVLVVLVVLASALAALVLGALARLRGIGRIAS